MWNGSDRNENHLEPVLAYDRVAPAFHSLSDRRRAYLAAVDRLIVARIPEGSQSLLDIGSGDGVRALSIAQSAGIREIVLLEPSEAMRSRWPTHVQGLAIRAEQLDRVAGVFDTVTCLWNVLGHIAPSENRSAVLRQCRRLLSDNGKMFIDVNNRYNFQHHGFLRTAMRMLRDRARPNDKNGDVAVSWNIDGKTYTTGGHVFRPDEFPRMAEEAGLTVEECITIDYGSGLVRRSRFAGNPLYVLRRTL